ncbi:efflux RND transporter periplasmic adaptor subunit [Sphingomonas sp.]|jgi:HlyD family secretion protein|uniref:efflux RND transporter periplasmic adaptor subunit n=1 Tax=Sphingomonas sp. TaxID=28214 RepID=UPI002D804B67|nr:efflux RND transporter periplasmic adaptor subunit [Sphingomonas sp.]HEU0043123.1 efflux RND transporter periplasmic adaptor subunit [Sphingomonas sp.]
MRSTLPIAALAAALVACSGEDRREAPTPPTPRSVRVATIELRPLAQVVAASGTLRPREEAAVNAELAGYRVLSVLADVGDFVRRGEALVRLDPALLEAQIAQQRANLDQQIARQRQAADQARRVAGLEGTGVLADEQIVQRRSEAANAAAAVRVARAQLQDTLTRRARLTVTAPVSGIVLSRGIRPGDVTGGGAAPFFTIARDGLVELQAELNEAALLSVRSGTPARVRLADGTEFQGAVRMVSPQVTPETRLGLVYVGLPVRRDARVGGYATAFFGVSATPTAAVPESAVAFTADGARLTVVGPDNRARQLPVRTGARGGGYVAVLKGPPIGTRVALGAASFVIEGEQVRPVRSGK